jgi:putative acetyltransferase
MAVRDDWQGKGAGTALMQAAIELADKWLNLTRLELEVYTDNEPAIRLYKKFGFAVEGTLTQYSFRDGQYVDSHLMARLRK